MLVFDNTSPVRRGVNFHLRVSMSSSSAKKAASNTLSRCKHRLSGLHAAFKRKSSIPSQLIRGTQVRTYGEIHQEFDGAIAVRRKHGVCTWCTVVGVAKKECTSLCTGTPLSARAGASIQRHMQHGLNRGCTSEHWSCGYKSECSKGRPYHQ